MKISAFGYEWQEPFSKEQIPNRSGRWGPFFTEVEMEVAQLAGYMKNNIIWSPFLFEGGARHGSNNKMKMDCWVFDYDEGGMTWQEIAKAMTKNENFFWAEDYQVIFAGSPRNNDDIHKYRIIIPFTETLDIDENYSAVYEKLIEEFEKVGVKLDGATKDLARNFYSVDFCEVHVTSDKVFGGFDMLYRKFRNIVVSEKKDKEIRDMLRGVYGQRGRERRARSWDGDIEPKFLVNKPLYQSYRGLISSMTAHEGVIKLNGYLKKCGCVDSDIEDHIWNIMVEEGHHRSHQEFLNEIRGL